ncbi:hypothetical protein [Primorskyibacter sp. S187A]|uniref:hypothetical protein n=1 Tax=Primorskyibacter sp. S187A TaxID=3415130 RepID=UPI003C79F6AF
MDRLINVLEILAIIGAALFTTRWIIPRGIKTWQTHRRRRLGRDRETSFAEAVEWTETGRIKAQPLERAMADCVVPLEMLFADDDHGLYYQLEMGQVSRAELTTWLEVTQTLELEEIGQVLEEAVLMHDVICHPDYDPEIPQDGGQLGWLLWTRAAELRAKVEQREDISRLRAACEAYLRRHAPDLLPLPVW